MTAWSGIGAVGLASTKLKRELSALRLIAWSFHTGVREFRKLASRVLIDLCDAQTQRLRARFYHSTASVFASILGIHSGRSRPAAGIQNLMEVE
jgi:hypothetical protein